MLGIIGHKLQRIPILFFLCSAVGIYGHVGSSKDLQSLEHARGVSKAQVAGQLVGAPGPKALAKLGKLEQVAVKMIDCTPQGKSTVGSERSNPGQECSFKGPLSSNMAHS